ncbi:hypothetical protein CRUP_012106 [Coryphaenoides rupestris]|nr:hypothetical protein CRUP_012106 [Coryphaenoides rupestris]
MPHPPHPTLCHQSAARPAASLHVVGLEEGVVEVGGGGRAHQRSQLRKRRRSGVDGGGDGRGGGVSLGGGGRGEAVAEVPGGGRGQRRGRGGVGVRIQPSPDADHAPAHAGVVAVHGAVVQVVAGQGGRRGAAELGVQHQARLEQRLGVDVLLGQPAGGEVHKVRRHLITTTTPLMLAVSGGHVDTVSLLLERNADANMADNHGLTALHLGDSSPHL